MTNVKLQCPVCVKDFITNNNQRIYCCSECRIKHERIREQVKLNSDKQSRIKCDWLIYDIDQDKFFIKSVYEKNKDIRPI